MGISILIIGIVTLVFMFYEDFKYRGIQWWLFLALALFSVVYGFYKTQNFEFLSAVPWSVLIALLLISSVLALFWLKSKIPLNKALGLGDVLFILAITPLFSTFDFILFLSISFLASAVIHLLLQQVKKSDTVPLAGYQSLVLGVYLVIDYQQPISLIQELNQLVII